MKVGNWSATIVQADDRPPLHPSVVNGASCVSGALRNCVGVWCDGSSMLSARSGLAAFCAAVGVGSVSSISKVIFL